MRLNANEYRRAFARHASLLLRLKIIIFGSILAGTCKPPVIASPLGIGPAMGALGNDLRGPSSE
jgi:hypothetical protein